MTKYIIQKKLNVICVAKPQQEKQCLNTDILTSCEAIENICKLFTEMLDDKHKYDIYIYIYVYIYIVWERPNYKKQCMENLMVVLT